MESGHIQRIGSKPEYDPDKLLPDQECPTMDLQPIAILNIISLITMLLVASSLSLVIFW